MILTFNILLNNYLHISNTRKLHKKNYNLYKVVNKSYIINVVYLASNLYKLYKLLFSLTLKKYHITVINTTKIINNKFLYYLIKFTKSNCFNRKWINGAITNEKILSSFIIINNFINNVYSTTNDPDSLLNNKFKILYYKYNFANYLKNMSFSKFIFFINLDSNLQGVSEGILKNKFISGAHDLNFDTKLIDFGVCCNNVNPKSINFVLKFLLTSLITAQSIKFKRG